MPREFVAYKIRNRETGLFSNGGCAPKWNKKGKAWGSLGNLKLHLSMFKAYSYNEQTKNVDKYYKLPAGYDNAEIIKLTYVLQEKDNKEKNDLLTFVKEHNINQDLESKLLGLI